MSERINSAAKALHAVKTFADVNGSPATINARTWFVCFVPGIKKQWWHPLVHNTHKHVFAMRPETDGAWTLLEPWWHRLLTASLTIEQARKFLMWAAAGDVVAVREDIPGKGSQVRGWMTCAAQVSYLLGRPYWAWTPHRLYRLLAGESNVLHVDVLALLSLSRRDLSAAVQAIAGPAGLSPPAKTLVAATAIGFGRKAQRATPG